MIHWGLSRAGIKVDFQGMANAYLYGTRFVTWLAYTYSPEKVIAWTRRDEGSKRYYADQFQNVFGCRSSRPGRTGLRSSTSSSERNLAEVRKFPITPRAQAGRERTGVGIAHVLR